MRANPIVAVCKDPGGTNGVLRVIEILRARGHEVRLFLDGHAQKNPSALSAGGVPISSTIDVLNMNPSPSAFLTSMCSGGGIGRDLVPLMHNICPTIALQDFWGARLKTDWSDLRFRPDYIVVHDELGARLVNEAWDFPACRIWQTGFPALDHYHGCDTEAARQKVRAYFRLGRNWPVVMYGGDVEYASAMLEEVVFTLNHLVERFYFYPRPHPRLRTEHAGEMRFFEQIASQFHNGVLLSLDPNDPQAPSFTELLAAADVVVANFSTILLEKALLRGPAISVLFPETGAKLLEQESGGLLRNYPLAPLCVDEVHSNYELGRAIERAIGDGGFQNRMIRFQQKRLPLNGQSGPALADRIERILIKK
ncbi:MAG TPA: hypothetical protein VFQ60_03330 [Patescibacteria group bacterium]|nr:hypothetical protein [Patescibacteria group bacterium]